jgi:hypothetical protein
MHRSNLQLNSQSHWAPFLVSMPHSVDEFVRVEGLPPMTFKELLSVEPLRWTISQHGFLSWVL